MLSPLATINSPARNRRQTTNRTAKNRRNDARPKTGQLIRTGFGAPYLVRVTRWIE
jgi:hypothetical protein